MRLLCAALLLLLPAALLAQPRVTATLSAEATAVGQPLSLSVEVLVPSFMPKPPVFPDLEQTRLLVRLPPRAGSPVTRKVEGEDWSGVSRRYLLTPLREGRYTLPESAVLVTWRGEGADGDLQAEAVLPPIVFESTVPAAAAGLTPPLLSEALVLEQSIEGGPEISAGQAVIRTVTARIDGVTPILLPPLLPQDETLPGLRAYPAEVQVDEQEDRGQISGTRTEKITYIAAAAGSAELPPVTLSWYDLSAQEVKTETLPGLTLTISAPPPVPKTPGQIAAAAAAVLAAAVLLFAAMRILRPIARVRLEKSRAARRASEAYARKQVKTALSAQDLSALHLTFQAWCARLPRAASAEARAAFPAIAAPLGAARFAARPAGPGSSCWATAARNFDQLSSRLQTRKNRAKTSALPQTLNSY